MKKDINYTTSYVLPFHRKHLRNSKFCKDKMFFKDRCVPLIMQTNVHVDLINIA
jgi:hypothetical protein